MKISTLIIAALVPIKLVAADVKCPNAETGSDLSKPALSVSINSDRKLIVCGYREPDRPEEFSEFTVYSTTSSGETSGAIFQTDAFHTFKITDVKNGLRFTELLSISNKKVPAFQSQITCDAKKCSPDREVCIYKVKKSGTADRLKEIETYISGKNKTKVPDEMIISSVGDLAYSGNKKAQRIFFHRPDTLALDAAPSEEFEFVKAMLSRLKERGCLP